MSELKNIDIDKSILIQIFERISDKFNYVRINNQFHDNDFNTPKINRLGIVQDNRTSLNNNKLFFENESSMIENLIGKLVIIRFLNLSKIKISSNM